MSTRQKPRKMMAATKIRDSLALIEKAITKAHSSMVGALVHIRRII